MTAAPPDLQKKRTIIKKPVLRLLRPDLTVKVKCPKQAYPGQNLGSSIKVSVKNKGTAPAANFFVDIVLSSNTWIPMNLASYSASYAEDVLLKGGRENISLLAAGAKVNVTMNGSNKIPADTPPGKYYIGVVVDPSKKVTELKENNNIAVYPIFIGPQITNAVQYFDWMVAPTQEMEITGTGFGNTQGNKTIKVGQYNISISPGGSWSSTKIYCHYPYNIPLGVHYPLYIMEGGNIISNQYDFFLKIVIFGNLFVPHQGPAGTSLHVDTMGAGSSKGQKKLMFGNTEAQTQSWNNASIQCTIPNLPPGTYNVYIKKAGETISNVVTYTILSPPFD